MHIVQDNLGHSSLDTTMGHVTTVRDERLCSMQAIGMCWISALAIGRCRGVPTAPELSRCASWPRHRTRARMDRRMPTLPIETVRTARAFRSAMPY